MMRRVQRRVLSESSGAVARVERMGFYMPERPDDEIPALPRDLTAVEDSDLMVLFSQFTAWSNYASGKRSEAEIEERRLSDALGFADAKAMILGWDEDTGRAADKKVTITKARKLADEDVQAALEEQRVAYAHRKLIATMAETFERSTALVSRELSRRIGNSDVTRRQHRWGGG